MYLMQNVTLSVNDLLACCGFLCGEGCDGGYPIAAWQYFKRTGVVTSEVNTKYLALLYHVIINCY